MTFRLVDSGWGKTLRDALREDPTSVRIVCPFIKRRALESLFGETTPAQLRVITRFNLDDFAGGVSDVSSLQWLLENGAQIRGIRNLHAKLYVFGEGPAVVTSANLTMAALARNHELGFVSRSTEVVDRCRQYFTDLWDRGGPDLSPDRLAEWGTKVSNHLASGVGPAPGSGLGDEGVDVGLPSDPLVLAVPVAEARQAFVKFFGESRTRIDRSTSVLKVLAVIGLAHIQRTSDRDSLRTVHSCSLAGSSRTKTTS